MPGTNILPRELRSSHPGEKDRRGGQRRAGARLVDTDRRARAENIGCAAEATCRAAAMSEKRPIYVVRLRGTGRDDIRELRRILKILLRRFGLRCVDITEEQVLS